MGGLAKFRPEPLNGRIAPIHDVQGAVPSSRYRTFISCNG